MEGSMEEEICCPKCAKNYGKNYTVIVGEVV